MALSLAFFDRDRQLALLCNVEESKTAGAAPIGRIIPGKSGSPIMDDTYARKLAPTQDMPAKGKSAFPET
jgi:hypothetical protein